MSAADDRRAVDRFVAGLDVEEDALATAIVGMAVDRTVIVEALLKALASPQHAVAVRAAQRIARMPHVADPVAARLRLIAGREHEGDERVRTACAAALRAHGLPTPGDDAEGDDPVVTTPVPAFARLLLRAVMMRSEQPVVSLEPVYRDDAPKMHGELSADDDDVLHVTLDGLPAALRGKRIELLVRRDADSTEPTSIATSQARVSPDGAVVIRIEPELGSARDVGRWLVAGAEVVASED